MAPHDGFGIFFIVLLMAIVAAGAGMLFSQNDVLAEDVAIANTVSERAVEKQVAAEKENASKSEQIVRLTGELEQANQKQQEAQAAIADLQKQLDETRAARNQAQEANQKMNDRINELQAQVVDAQRRPADTGSSELAKEVVSLRQKVQELQNQLAQAQADNKTAQTNPIGNAIGSIVDDNNGILVLVAVTTGALILGMIVVASFRILPQYDEEPRKNDKAALGEETFYVRMSRDEARKYARDRSQPVQAPDGKAAGPRFDHNTRREPGKGYQGERIKGRQQ